MVAPLDLQGRRQEDLHAGLAPLLAVALRFLPWAAGQRVPGVRLVTSRVLLC